MSDPHHGPPAKPKIAPGDPINPRPGYGRLKVHFLLASLIVFYLASQGTIHVVGGILLGVLFLVWSVDNEYFDYA